MAARLFNGKEHEFIGGFLPGRSLELMSLQDLQNFF
jgi:hypothetical protein